MQTKSIELKMPSFKILFAFVTALTVIHNSVTLETISETSGRKGMKKRMETATICSVRSQICDHVFSRENSASRERKRDISGLHSRLVKTAERKHKKEPKLAKLRQEFARRFDRKLAV